MAKSLPESIDLSAAIRKEWVLTGEIMLSDLNRMPRDLIHSKDAVIQYEISFKHAKDVIGKALIKVESQLDLICQRSLDTFAFPFQTEKTVGFISDLEDEANLGPNVSPSWVENTEIDPRTLLEDEILLVLPTYPVKPGAELNCQYLEQGETEEAVDERQNPFSVLKELK